MQKFLYILIFIEILTACGQPKQTPDGPVVAQIDKDANEIHFSGGSPYLYFRSCRDKVRVQYRDSPGDPWQDEIKLVAENFVAQVDGEFRQLGWRNECDLVYDMGVTSFSVRIPPAYLKPMGTHTVSAKELASVILGTVGPIKQKVGDEVPVFKTQKTRYLRVLVAWSLNNDTAHPETVHEIDLND